MSEMMSGTDLAGPGTAAAAVAAPRRTKFVVLSALSGVGKTHTGDYLALYRDYTHVDGDRPLLWSHLPRYKPMVDSFRKAISAWGQGGEPRPEQWRPYYDEIAKDALEAAQHSERVVVSNWFHRREFREYFRELIGGDVEWIQLVCDLPFKTIRALISPAW